MVMIDASAHTPMNPNRIVQIIQKFFMSRVKSRRINMITEHFASANAAIMRIWLV